jgi:hypothetical protein
LGIATVDRLVVALHWDDASGKQTAQYIEAASRKGAGGVAAPRDEGQARRRKIQIEEPCRAAGRRWDRFSSGNVSVVRACLSYTV